MAYRKLGKWGIKVVGDLRKPTVNRNGKSFNWRWFAKAVFVVLVSSLLLSIPIVDQPLFNAILFVAFRYPSGLYENNTIGGIKPKDVFSRRRMETCCTPGCTPTKERNEYFLSAMVKSEI